MTSTIDALFADGSAGDRCLRVTPHQREFVAGTLWILVTFVQFSGDELLLYPLALYFAIRAWQEREAVFGLMARSWPIMLFPIWCLISPIWAVEPMEALKQAIYLSLTMLICYHVVLHLSPRQIMYAVLAATGAIGVLTFVLGVSSGNFAWALFPHKNRMGISMLMLWTVAVATMLDPASQRLIRIIAAGAAVLAAFLVFNSDSATAILLMLATGGICLAGASALLGGFLRPSRIALTCLVLALTAGGGSVGISTFKGDPVGAVLGHFGKDRTLTGRTVLWQYATAQIGERPVLGVGAGGFWRYHASPLVQRIYEEHHRKPRDHFNFHNSYYEIAVHQGLVGLGIVIIAQFWATGWILRGALTLGTMPHIYFFCAASAILVRTFTEADFYKHFIIFHMLFWIGALSAMRAAAKSPPV
ncbi:MAG: O-antigen ligase family protein [Pseudomonadota bacterium]